MQSTSEIKEHLNELYLTEGLHPEVVTECINYWEIKFIIALEIEKEEQTKILEENDR
tara:strand:+ start:113 stop:283 length:171 start_codon:yes stop_codon:yes gene_type:complete